MLSKVAIRQQFKQKRKAIPATKRHQASQKACQNFLHSHYFKQSQTIAAYFPHNAEIDPMPIAKHCEAKQKLFVLPRVQADNLLFLPMHLNMSKNSFGIQEPNYVQNKLINVAALDCLLMPLVAFDRHGHRLGMGAGFYDRCLAQLPAKHGVQLIGFAYAMQEVEHIAVDAWDIDLHAIITENEIIVC